MTPAKILVMAFIVASLPAHAATLYVDQQLASDCSSYDPSSRTCTAGVDRAYSQLDGGLAAVVPGDILYIRGGTYGQLAVQVSGSPDNPIEIRAFDSETPVISSSNLVGLSFIRVSDVHIRDLVVRDVVGFGRVEESTGIVIDNVSFSAASSSGTTGSLKFVRASNNAVVNSNFSDGSDLLIFQDASNRNVVKGNVFGTASHSEISIRCSSMNVFRDNEFRNPRQKSMELYDCEGVSDAPFRLDDAKRNVIENNRFYQTRASGAYYDYNAIQHGGQQTIVRYNVFAGNAGGGVQYQKYSDESLFVYGNRLYNNTFYDNRCFAFGGATGTPNRFYDNRVVNNLLYMNTDCNGGGQQENVQDRNAVILSGNSLVNNDPGFQNAATGDFGLVASSNEIDNGEFVTRTAFAGTGNMLTVQDASWFYDGFGIAGEIGDFLRVEGQAQDQTARILSIDYQTNIITLDRTLVWDSGVGVHIAFRGVAPDVGAFEFSQAVSTTTPNPPSNFQAN